MGRLLVSDTPIAGWHALIREAELASGHLLEEELEHYLVNVLLRYTDKPELVSSVLAIECLEADQLSASQRKVELHQVGDKCLLLSGFYPEYADHKLVSREYFIDMGQYAYGSLSALYTHSSRGELFSSLNTEFLELIDLLYSVRKVATH